MITTIDNTFNGHKRISEKGDKVKKGNFNGKSKLAGLASEVLLAQLGGGLEVGWGRVDHSQVYGLTALHQYEWTVQRRNLPYARSKTSMMMAHILDALSSSSRNRYIVFMGHAGDLSGVGFLLNAHWRAPPFPDNTVAPGVALRLENDGSRIKMEVVYTTYDTEEGVPLVSPVFDMPITEFCNLVVNIILTGNV
mmetsp:Transcript_11857/g.14107  ORF Transcript_11857/g.14107 Transcript_11857/m.14107 type:complete len:194 (+) Transcript_11857:239-820(+)|eukprot:CAMPEP_0197846386 /NCGR_PEP_ID=MMETSP1438-20131217/3131_1 /TAXON_ID=1461541 /ORGANISM="Pterosperma sp., Strain CCMP1384" /LENGTH=193 /DNA_ID=CAMNT_0043458011 /DNA_START=1707 /DNA_END=2288 /DNA_ORIENTATION=-